MTLYDTKGRKQQALPENAAQEAEGNLDTIAEATAQTQADLMRAILAELRVHTFILSTEFGVTQSDVESLRAALIQELAQ